MNEIIKKITLISSLLCSPLQALENTSLNAQQSVIVCDKSPLNRTEVLIKSPVVRTDGYIIYENQNNKEFYKTRFQILPAKYNSISAGIVIQTIGSGAIAHNLGLVGRIQGKLSEQIFVKGDVRYFPSDKTIDTYAFVDSKYAFSDLLGSYNTEKGVLTLIPGMELKLGNNLSVGVEGKCSGKAHAPEKKYAGFRFKARF